MQVAEDRLVCGFGINDASYVVSKYKRESGKTLIHGHARITGDGTGCLCAAYLGA